MEEYKNMIELTITTAHRHKMWEEQVRIVLKQSERMDIYDELAYKGKY